MEMLEIAGELLGETMIVERSPGLLDRHMLHSVNDVVRDSGATVGETFTFPQGCIPNQVFSRECSRLGAEHSRSEERC
jgi:hypothetical protein